MGKAFKFILGGDFEKEREGEKLRELRDKETGCRGVV